MNRPHALIHLRALSLVCAGLAVATSACQSGDVVEVDDEEMLEELDDSSDVSITNRLVDQHASEDNEALYEEHAQGWLEWVMALPWSTGPVTDPNGDQCGLGEGQDGNVFYLAGTEGGPVTRTCQVPPGSKLFFPLIDLWSTPPARFVDTPQELANFVGFFTGYFPLWRDSLCSLTLRIDGVDLLPSLEAMDEALWVGILEPFPVTLDADNWMGAPGGVYPAAVHAGQFALLKPLSVGEHVIEFGGASCDGEVVDFETSATYYITVAN